MWHNVPNKLPEHKYNPIYNKDFIPDFDAPLEERGFRVPPKSVPRPDTPWQRFIDEYGSEVDSNILKELDNQPTAELQYPEFTEEDLRYSQYLLNKSQGISYEDWLFTFADINDQADKLSWYIFEHTQGTAYICKEAGIHKEDLLAIISGKPLTSAISLFKLFDYLGVKPKYLYYNIKKVKDYDTTHLFRTANSVG